jgi:hypothetical protein
MKRTPVESKTGMCSYGYDPVTERLEIAFKSRKEGEPDKVYQYVNFPQEEWEKFLAAESKGSFFLKSVKPNYECQKLEPEGKPSEEKDKAEDKAS